MGQSAVQLVFSAAIGLYVIVFARTTFSQPERIRQRWYSWLPDRPWTSRLLRGFAVFLMFAGFLVIAVSRRVSRCQTPSLCCDSCCYFCWTTSGENSASAMVRATAAETSRLHSQPPSGVRGP